MAGLHAVKTLVDHVVVPGYGLVDKAQTTVQITQDNFNLINANTFSSGKLQDMGAIVDPTDGVATVAPFVAQPAALTAPATFNAAYTNSEHNQLRNDVAALQGTVAALLTALKGVGKPMSPS